MCPRLSPKSIIVSVAYPAWILGRDPTERIICISYSDDLASTHARNFQAIVQSPWYRRAFPEMRIARNTMQELSTTLRGSRYSTSIDGTLTGLGGNLIIIDDPIKVSDALSKSRREAVNDKIRTTVPSRFDQPKRGKMLLIMQRAHIDDPVGMALKRGNWEHLSLPAIAEADVSIQLARGRVYHRKKGELLHPAHMPLEKLEEIRAELGPYAFSAQYQQTPVPVDGGLVQAGLAEALRSAAGSRLWPGNYPKLGRGD